ncbi:LysR family transcriptional regulator [Burkholderia cenocepacia]|uniref:LysR family transcriptional regulator n=1 Tax=Burkholderia cenocepacia TaxID=95486 RepID=UPI001905FFEF|nr:LysR family transcriptional regulator [Burkholderia cenocepacia]MBJ9696799.1 LysR family transcriptional regulator [Burkholderia cenocepacia]
MDNISEFALFRTIVQSGGISAGALALHSSPPAVSRRLAALEKRLGVRLAHRSSRRFKLTDEGLLLYERCCSILDQIRDAEAEVASRGGAARGLLRVGAPADFGRHHIAPLLADFTSRHPGLYTHLLPSDAGLEVGVDPCDVILRFGLPNDLDVIARKLVSTASVLCAAPAYLARHGAPTQPAQLGDHNCLRLQGRHRMNDIWHFDKDGAREEVQVDGTLSSTSGEVLLQWALAGEGISQEAYWDVAEHIDSGRLVRVMPDYTCPALDLYAVYAPGSPIPPRIRLFVEHIAHALSAHMPRVA